MLRHRMLCPQQTVLVAVSGGPDSVALLHVLEGLRHRWKLKLVVCHLNHQLRGKDSAADAAFVRSLGARLGLSVYGKTCNVRALASRRGLGLEEAGREARYRFLRAAQKKYRADRIALGHSRDDQVETILHHLLRGSGLRGLEGMTPIRDEVFIRPLLDVNRADILDFLSAGGHNYRMDSSNQDRRFLRNRIRLDLLPLLERDYNPQVREALLKLSKLAQVDNALLDAQAGQSLRDITIASPGRCQWEARALVALPDALRGRVVLKSLESMALAEGGFSSSHVDRVLGLAAEGKSGRVVELPAGVRAWRQFDHIVLSTVPPSAAVPFDLILPIPGEVDPPGGQWTLTARAIRPARKLSLDARNNSSCQAVIMLERTTGQLYVRSHRPGDRYEREHSRTVKKLWNDARVPLEVRRYIPLVFEGQRLVWIPGFHPARNPAVREGSNVKTVHLSLNCSTGSVLDQWLAMRRGAS